MYLIITKSGCLSCEEVREFFEKSKVKFREVNCSNDELSVEDIEIMKSSPNNSLAIYLKRDYIRNREKISREELKDIFSNFVKYGSFPIIIKYNFLNQLENYSIGFSKKIIQKWIDNDSIVGQYIDINYAFKSINCCYMCDRKTLIEKIEAKEKLHVNDSIDRLNSIKQESKNFVEKYTKAKAQENINENSEDLIMASELPRYRKNSFNNNNEVFRKQSTSTLEIPINLYVEPEQTQLEKDKTLINKFKDKFQKLGKNKIKKEEDFIVEHIKTSREESEFDESLIFGKKNIVKNNSELKIKKEEDFIVEHIKTSREESEFDESLIFGKKNIVKNNSELKIKKIKKEKDDIEFLNKEIDDMNELLEEQKKNNELFAKETLEEENEIENNELNENSFVLEEVDFSKNFKSSSKEDLDADITENFIENKNDYDDEIDSEFRKNLIQEKYMLADDDFESLYVSKEKDINE